MAGRIGVRSLVMMLLLAWTTAAQAQSVTDAATFGAIATLAPLCGLRDEVWSTDLRHAAGSGNQIAAALGYGDMEALEDFAADKPEATCSALGHNPALGRADAAVDAFRRRRDGKPIG
jgi:hypothetical protein